MHDTVIRGGTIIDGSGQPGYTGDVALQDGKIAQVGGKIGPGRREIAADGLLVTPGWVDVHTHYDGQAMWDSELAPSSWHGVSTVLFGNCGVGFAPVRNTDHSALIGMMESIEEIPGIALADGLKWNWETFPEYLDALEQMPRAKLGPRPQAGMYAFFEIDGMPDSRAACLDILAKTSVGLAPGHFFGPGSNGFLRACVCRKPEVLTQAMARLSEALS